MTVREVREGDRGEWLRMRQALWPDCPPEQQAEEVAGYLRLGPTGGRVFVAERPGGGLCGFLEAFVRSVAEGSWDGPVGYIEGWYVDPDVRRRGVGRGLVEAAERWAVSIGCRQMGSDAEIGNAVSITAHTALGYGEVNRLVHFRKVLGG